jgi:integrase
VEAGPAWRDEQGLVCTLQDGSPYHPPTLESTFRRAARKAGLTISFHTLRHTHASLLLKAGCP